VKDVVVVDTGLGNIASVVRALGRCGGAPVVSREPELVGRAGALVVPGQGAFRDCARALDGALGRAVREAITRGTPYLGICLGLQILFSSSDEAPGCAGLGVFPGHVARLAGGPGIKVPHVGWNLVTSTRTSLLLDKPEHFYFVHSYVVVPDDPTVIVATTTHGERFVSAVARDNVTAVQFHPEKSQRAGLALLERWLA
jgi:imidazole glycerol-phosphate synthase subunit HisH